MHLKDTVPATIIFYLVIRVLKTMVYILLKRIAQAVFRTASLGSGSKKESFVARTCMTLFERDRWSDSGMGAMISDSAP
jgi:hypothetical protein